MVAAEEVADIVDRLGEEEDAALEDAEGGEEEALDAKGIGGEPVMPVIEPAVLEEDDEEVSQEAS
jgi:hypothetical protein